MTPANLRFLASSLLLFLMSASASAQSPYPRSGWIADLATRQHGVSGRVTLLDQDTFRVDGFNYDGGGASVFFYLGIDESREAFIAGIPANPSDLLGTRRTNATLTFDLPNGATFDGYNSIAVWCVPFQANFGSGTFVPPVSIPEPASATALLLGGLLLRRRRRVVGRLIRFAHGD